MLARTWLHADATRRVLAGGAEQRRIRPPVAMRDRARLRRSGQTLISPRLFVMDVDEAIVFDPDSTALSLGLPEEAPNTEARLNYLNRFFEVRKRRERLTYSAEQTPEGRRRQHGTGG